MPLTVVLPYPYGQRVQFRHDGRVGTVIGYKLSQYGINVAVELDDRQIIEIEQSYLYPVAAY